MVGQAPVVKDHAPVLVGQGLDLGSEVCILSVKGLKLNKQGRVTHGFDLVHNVFGQNAYITYIRLSCAFNALGCSYHIIVLPVA